MARYKILNPEGVEIEHDLFVKELLQIIGSGVAPFIDLSNDISTLVIKSAEDESFTIETELGEEVLKVDTNAKTFEILAPYNLAGDGAVIKFSEEKTAIAGDNGGAWVVRSLGAGYENKEVAIIMEKIAAGGTATAGIRKVSSTFNLSFLIKQGHVLRFVEADALGDIEIFSDSNNISFTIIGIR